MRQLIRPALILVAAVALIAPIPVAAAPTPPADTETTRSFDTPPPTAKPTPKATKKPPKKTPPPDKTEPPVVAATGPALVALEPVSDTLTVGYRGDGIIAQAPLVLALVNGYYDDAGFDGVTIVQANDPLADVLSGDLDIGVVASPDAYAAHADAPGIRALAGHQNYLGADGAFGGDVLLARSGLVADEPATVIAFLSAYVRALTDLADEESAADALAALQDTQLFIDPEVAADWTASLAAFAPFDGGFGDVDNERGLGELAEYLSEGSDEELDLDAFLASHVLNIAQAWREVSANPDGGFFGPPGVTDITIAVSGAADLVGPIAAAAANGYFTDAGFDRVKIIDVEQPLPGVIGGQVDFGVVDAVDAADGAIQGLPLRALAGHANLGADGATYGGDLVITRADLIDGEPSTITAFLIAYIRGLRDVAENGSGAAFAPHDGGFGDRSEGGGLAQLSDHVTAALGETPDPSTLIASQELALAQAWWGLPANPTPDVEAA